MRRSHRWVGVHSSWLASAALALGPASFGVVSFGVTFSFGVTVSPSVLAQEAPQPETQPALEAAAPSSQQPESEEADAQQKAAAEALFDEGKQLLNQGQYESACRKLEQSDAIDHGVGVLLYLGECYERSGRMASAWAIFREANSRAKAAGQLERAKVADDRARRLSGVLSKLVLLVPQGNRAPGFELLLNGRLISPALYGVPFPVDAGQHELTARAPGRQTWSNIVEVKANADFRNVQVPQLGEGRSSSAAPSAATTPYDSSSSTNFKVEGGGAAAPSGPRRDLTPVYLLGGVGALAVGVGAVFGVRAADKDDESKPFCPSDCRTVSAANKNEAARTSAMVANISYGVGALALLGTAYWFFFSGSSSESATRPASRLQLGGDLRKDQGFVSVSGNF